MFKEHFKKKYSFLSKQKSKKGEKKNSKTNITKS